MSTPLDVGCSGDRQLERALITTWDHALHIEGGEAIDSDETVGSTATRATVSDSIVAETKVFYVRRGYTPGLCMSVISCMLTEGWRRRRRDGPYRLSEK